MDICSFVFLSVGPVGPRGGGIYSIIEDVVCQAYVLRTGLKPNNCGYMQFCLCSIIEDSLCQVYLLETFTHETFTHRRHLPIASIRYDA